MKAMTNKLRSDIQTYIKNGLDISNLIKDVDIKGENLSNAIIKEMSRIEVDISNCNFSHTKLGCPEKILAILRCKMTNCNFEGAEFVGRAWVRSCNARCCNFKNANVALADYQNTDFRDSTFCSAIIRIGTSSGIGAIFDTSFFADLTKGWGIEIEVKPKRS